MKQFITIIIALLMGIGLNAFSETNETPLKTKIRKATVFIQGAQISREGNTSINSGNTILVVKGLSRFIDANTIQVQGMGTFTVLSVNHRMNYLNSSEKTEKEIVLENKLKKIQDQIIDLRTGIQIYGEREKMLVANSALASKGGTLSAESLIVFAEFYSKSMEEIKRGVLEKQRKIGELEKEAAKIRKQLQEISSGKNGASSEILITIDSKTNISAAKFKITYLVGNAGWFPSYDIRVNDLQKPIELVYKANVFQSTGVDWKDVKLTFSNATPHKSGTAPVLKPFYIDFYTPVYLDEVVSVKRKGVRSSKSELASMPVMVAEGDADEEYSMPLAVNTVDNSSSVEFNIQLPYTIYTNKQAEVIEMIHHKLPATYNYLSVPKMEKSAFLMAGIMDWEDFNLLPGEANLFFEGTFVGKSLLDVRNLKDTMKISLSRDNGIVVSREKQKDFSSHKFMGSNRIESRSWKIDIRNNKSHKISITVIDQVPVSTQKDIEVERLELSGGKYNKDTGEVMWKLEIEPKTTRTLILRYEVKYPKNQTVVID
ncbi:MAG: mucoidy inhibitor MuiA family protein [Bacteroidota bacterium]|nr:mucoidy inhibitor MuiA family protein [Bacteroidota bacterium]